MVEAILLRVTLKTVLPVKWRKKGNETEKEKSKAAVNRLNELLDFCQLYWLFELQLKLSYPDNSIHAPLALIYVINRENITPAWCGVFTQLLWRRQSDSRPSGGLLILSSFVIVIAWKLITFWRLTHLFGVICANRCFFLYYGCTPINRVSRS